MDYSLEQASKEELLSKGIKYLTPEIVYKYFEAVPDNYTVIEVGQGNGVVLSMLKEKFPKKTFIGVDDKTIDFIPAGKFTVAPRYKTVDDLIEENPKLIDNCVLFLNWPTPNKSTYDIEAYQKLKPVYMIAIVELSGVAGGEKFLALLHEMGSNYGKDKSNRYDLEEDLSADLQEDPTADLQEDPTADLQEDPTADLQEDPTADLQEDPTADLSEDPTADTKEDSNDKETEYKIQHMTKKYGHDGFASMEFTVLIASKKSIKVNAPNKLKGYIEQETCLIM